MHATQILGATKINLVFFEASPIKPAPPSLQDLARPGFLPVGIGLFAGKAYDQVVLHDVVNGVALIVHAQEMRKRRGIGENIWQS